MLSKNQIKFIRSLHLAKYRQQHGLFIAEGPKLAMELLHSDFKVHAVYSTDHWHQEHGKDVPPGMETVLVSTKELERISTLNTPNDVLLVVGMRDRSGTLSREVSDLVLVLDGLRDPGNLGTIIRTADWYGVREIVCSPDSVDVYNPKVVQATMGSIARVRVHYLDLAHLLLNRAPGTAVFGALLDGKSIYEQDLSTPGYLVIGSESHGISAPVIPYITHPLFIPPHGKAGAESLNASVATAIVLAEFRRHSKL